MDVLDYMTVPSTHAANFTIYSFSHLIIAIFVLGLTLTPPPD